MTLSTILLAILVWHFVGKDWVKKEKESFKRKEDEYLAQREARYKKYKEEESRE